MFATTLVAGGLAIAAPAPASATGSAAVSASVPEAAAVAPGLRIYTPKAPRYQANCFGRIGTFRPGSRVFIVDWERNGSEDECFGIGTDRKVFHIWSTWTAWRQMDTASAGPGIADDIYKIRTRQDGWHEVIVRIGANDLWITSGATGLGWSAWIRCPTGYC
ncbi:hypothetical protein [Cryptosporangium minutisporangium]|uniref:Secreted protein n=1 Tax=Cryptosporangium minutisporangium TaxID=113569 RepID=A0ABP6T162_9ACTN